MYKIWYIHPWRLQLRTACCTDHDLLHWRRTDYKTLMTSLVQQHARHYGGPRDMCQHEQIFGTAGLRKQAHWSFINLENVEFTVTVILVWFATCLNATSDVCRTLPSLIAVTANCDVFHFFFSSFNLTVSNDDPENLHNFRNYGTRSLVLLMEGGLAAQCFIFYPSNVTSHLLTDVGHEAGA